jgi:hypothetical protein
MKVKEAIRDLKLKDQFEALTEEMDEAWRKGKEEFQRLWPKFKEELKDMKEKITDEKNAERRAAHDRRGGGEAGRTRVLPVDGRHYQSIRMKRYIILA